MSRGKSGTAWILEGIADLEYRKLGRTDIEVSVIALGCWPFAGGLVWGDQDDDLSVATVHAALDAGINFFDTAEGYGDGYSEAVLGRSLIGRREEAVIATKIAPPHLGCDEVEKRCDRSLKKLRTDYIDYYQIHWPNWEIPIKETLAALERLLQKGKVRAIGVSISEGETSPNCWRVQAWRPISCPTACCGAPSSTRSSRFAWNGASG